MSQQFLTLAGEQFVVVAMGCIAIMGVVDGLVIRRVSLHYFGVTTFTGAAAQVIGYGAVALALASLFMFWKYVSNLMRYCHANAGCYVGTPLYAVVFSFIVPILYLVVLILFVDWLRRRRKGIRWQMTPIALTPSGPHIHATIQQRLAEAGVPQMSKKKVEDQRDQVNRLIPLMLLQSRNLVMTNGEVNSSKVVQILLATPMFRNSDRQVQVVVSALAEEYVNAINQTEKRRWKGFLRLPMLKPKQRSQDPR